MPGEGWRCKESPGSGICRDLLMSLFIGQHTAQGKPKEKLTTNKECECWEAAGTSLCHSSFQQDEEKGSLRGHEEFPRQILTGLGSDSSADLLNTSFKGGSEKALQSGPASLRVLQGNAQIWSSSP